MTAARAAAGLVGAWPRIAARQYAFRLLAVVVPAALVLGGCAGRTKGLRGTPRAVDGDVGVYRVQAADPDGEKRRFKLLLWAAEPDRLHGEIVAPVGGTALVFDGGGGNLAVNFVRDRLAFAGSGEADALGRLFGVRLSLEELVAGLLTGEGTPGDSTVTRRPPKGGGLPQWLEIRDGERTLVLELRERRQLPVGADVGHGRPTEGFDLHPLEALELYPLPLDPPSHELRRAGEGDG